MTVPKVVIIGYSGHGYVAADILRCSGRQVVYYCDSKEKNTNPFNLGYCGSEGDFLESEKYKTELPEFFVSVGDNNTRSKISRLLSERDAVITNAVHPSAIIAGTASIGKGVFIAGGVIINPLCQIGNGAICNTNSAIDHECIVNEFAHIGPGAVLSGNVLVGARAFVGANAVVRQGIEIGENAVIGAGAVVVKNVPAGETWVGNPARRLKSEYKT